MKIILGLLMMVISFGVLADHSVTHNVETAIEKGIFKTSDFAYCRVKAEMAADVFDKAEVTPVDEQVNEVLVEAASLKGANKMPWYLVVEMQRIVRDAYRFKGTRQEYYTEVFEDCAVGPF